MRTAAIYVALDDSTKSKGVLLFEAQRYAVEHGLCIAGIYIDKKDEGVAYSRLIKEWIYPLILLNDKEGLRLEEVNIYYR